MSTQYYGWDIPVEGQDPWFDTLDDLFRTIDSSVNSAATVAAVNPSIVISAYADKSVGLLNRAIIVSSDRLVDCGTDGQWQVCSWTGYGAIVGSFSLISSGAQAELDLRLFASVFQLSTAFEGGCTARFRLILSRTGVTSLVIPNNSAWFAPMQVDVVPLKFVTTCSLGPGNYRAELQAGRTIITNSNFYIDNPITLLASEFKLP